MRINRILTICAVPIALAGCGDDAVLQEPASSPQPLFPSSPEAPPVEIVASSVTSDTPRWTLASEPTLRLGVVDGDTTQTFAGVAYAARLPDGSVLVLDGRSAQIRRFTSDGRLESRQGGRGEGPGEFREFSWARIQGDGDLVVYDRFGRRVSILTPEGTAFETESLGALSNAGRPEWRFAGRATDGRYLVAQGPEVLDRLMALSDGDTLRYPIDVVLADPSGAGPDTIATTSGPLHVGFVFGAGADGRPAPRRVSPLPLTHEVLAETDGARVVVSRTDRYELNVVDLATGTRRLFTRSDLPADPIDETTLERYRALGIRPGMVPPGATEPIYVEFPIEYMLGQPHPTHSRILLDDAGRIWVRGPAYPWDEDPPTEWVVFTGEGEIEAVATFPSELEVFHIGGEHVTGRIRDDLGVEYVVTYRVGPT